MQGTGILRRLSGNRFPYLVRRRQLLHKLAAAFAPPQRRKLYKLLHKFIPV
ncbi:hypothetical protein NEIPOLOT_00469 [Neisseria polysaccharea ATCC 43768]|nr:hypothetical protein NEIPOLOT_00469 [Neisseria polysaccharea ATCC 43768]